VTRDERIFSALDRFRIELPSWGSADTGPWNVTRTLTNAVLRRAGTQETDGALHIAVEDVEVSETETRTQAAVALLVDTSFSMVMENRWLPMKQTALALNHLVSTRFRSDALQIIAFGRYARTVTAAELTGLEGVYEQGTNLHHALALAVRHLRRHPRGQRELPRGNPGPPRMASCDRRARGVGIPRDPGGGELSVHAQEHAMGSHGQQAIQPVRTDSET